MTTSATQNINQTQPKTLNIGIAGAGGRMGRMLIQAISQNPATTLVATIERAGSSLLGVDAGELVGMERLNVALTDDLNIAIADTGMDVLIDFSSPDATVAHVAICQTAQVAMVIGTTGLNDQQNAQLQIASQDIAIVYAGNYSTGINVTLKLIEMAVKAFGDTADIEIIEAHHKHKVDAPSGTAFMMAQTAAQARGQALNDVVIYGRQGQTGARATNSIGIHAIRGGEIIGDHGIMLITDGEMVEIKHHARERMTFATGAVRAAIWVAQRQKSSTGLYDMQDVLGLTS